MTMARAHLVDPSVTRWYHCITRCVRRALLLGEGPKNRKLWIENRMGPLRGTGTRMALDFVRKIGYLFLHEAPE